MAADYGSSLWAILQWYQNEQARKDQKDLLNREPKIDFKNQPDSGFWNAQGMEHNDWMANLRQSMGRTFTEGMAPYAKSGLTATSDNWNPAKFSMQDSYKPGMSESSIPMQGRMAGAQFDPKGLDYLINNPGQFDRPTGAITYEDWLMNSQEGLGLVNTMNRNNKPMNPFAGGGTGQRPMGGGMQQTVGDTGGDWSRDYYENPYNGGGGFGSDPRNNLPGGPGAAVGGTDPNRDRFGLQWEDWRHGSPEQQQAYAAYDKWLNSQPAEVQERERQNAARVDQIFAAMGRGALNVLKADPIGILGAIATAGATGGMSIIMYLADKLEGKGFADVRNYYEKIKAIFTGGNNQPQQPPGSTPNPGTPGWPYGTTNP